MNLIYIGKFGCLCFLSMCVCTMCKVKGIKSTIRPRFIANFTLPIIADIGKAFPFSLCAALTTPFGWQSLTDKISNLSVHVNCSRTTNGYGELVAFVMCNIFLKLHSKMNMMKNYDKKMLTTKRSVLVFMSSIRPTAVFFFFLQYRLMSFIVIAFFVYNYVYLKTCYTLVKTRTKKSVVWKCYTI